MTDVTNDIQVGDTIVCDCVGCLTQAIQPVFVVESIDGGNFYAENGAMILSEKARKIAYGVENDEKSEPDADDIEIFS